MSDFHMNWAYNKGERPKIPKKVSNFEDHTENFYSDKAVHFFKMGESFLLEKLVSEQGL
jgi:hypothetical protein